MLNSKSRFVIGIEGTPVVIRFVPSRNDPAKLALKACHPEAIGSFLALGGLTAGEQIQGRNFFIAEVGRAEFLAALPAIVAKVLEANVPTADAPVVTDEVSDDEASEEPSAAQGKLLLFDASKAD